MRDVLTNFGEITAGDLSGNIVDLLHEGTEKDGPKYFRIVIKITTATTATSGNISFEVMSDNALATSGDALSSSAVTLLTYTVPYNKHKKDDKIVLQMPLEHKRYLQLKATGTGMKANAWIEEGA